MQHLLPRRLALLVLTLGLAACASWPGPGWVTLIDGERGLDNWNRVGDANWQVDAGGITANQGKGGFLVSKQSYKDFVIYAEFWAASDTNSGIFFRASDPARITADNSYEANIWDIRPDPTYATGAIVNFAPVPKPPVYLAGGRWNTMEITAQGELLTVKLNGVQTVQIRNNKYSSGPFALQYGAGVQGANGGPIKWRMVRIKPL
ncbi:MAG: DUF1080 domain-containing protein [Curvibacter sp.]